MSVETLRVEVGSRVVLQDASACEREQYVIVEAAEADSVNGRVSTESPLGRALLGLTVGQQADVCVRAAKRTVRILAIEPTRWEGWS